MAPTVRGALAGPGGAGRITIGKKFFLKVKRRTREPVLKKRMRASAQIPTSLS